jgi:hypothetical protein
MAIVAIVAAAVLPLFRALQNSWDSKAGAAETLQSGRVLLDHMNRNLSKASRITAVSDSSDTNGYIEFLDNDANSYRYDVNSAGNYVEFGPVGSLSDLAGPVSQLRFTCYSALDLDTPVTAVDSIRSVKVEATVINPAALDHDMIFSTQAYLRTNTLPAAGGEIVKMSDPWIEFDTVNAQYPALAHMSGTKYLCAYRGDGYDGWACILTANSSDWSVSASGFFEYKTKDVGAPALAKIDDAHFLCAHEDEHGDGRAVLLYESAPGIIANGPDVQFDTADGASPALCKIVTQGDDHYFLCAYQAPYEVRAVVLTATVVPAMALAAGTKTSFAAAYGPTPALAMIDETHYLCAYKGTTGSEHGAAVVLTVNPTDWTVAAGTHFDFLGEYAAAPELTKIDDTHYLCTYLGSSSAGRAVVLTVSPADWSVAKEAGPDFLIDSTDGSLPTCSIDNVNFLCAYRSLTAGGSATVLTVNAGDWSISKKTPLAFEPSMSLQHALYQIDTEHYLCAYSGLATDGFVGVLELGAGILP